MRKQNQSLSVPAASRRRQGFSEAQAQSVWSSDRWLVRRLLQACGDPPLRVILWNGETISPPGAQPETGLRLKDRGALYRLLSDPNLQFGDLYSAGRLEVEGDLVEFLRRVYAAMSESVENSIGARMVRKAAHRPRRNSPDGSRSNIHHHYDIGNPFYSLWLDREAMQYTCAYYPDTSMTLEAAQLAKMHHVCRKLRLQPGETVFEAGCGWGGLARFMAREYGVQVKAFNISHEQVSYAREQAAREGLDGKVEYIEDDYRNISGRCDAFVSVGMLEHVGLENYRALGGVIDRALDDDGRGLIHSIGRNRSAPMNPWIERRIFPGARPPALSEMSEIFEPYAFSVQDVENLRLHYARTLEHWLERYEREVEQVRDMFDETFVRAWRLYLSGSIAAFYSGALQLFQVVFTRPRNNALPWSRVHLYQDH